MKNKIKVLNFLFEMVITLLPFIIGYLLLANWLSGVEDLGRTFIQPAGKPVIREMSEIWIGFDIYGDRIADYTFEVVHIFWGLLISVILLILLGKLMYLAIVKFIENRMNRDRRV